MNKTESVGNIERVNASDVVSRCAAQNHNAFWSSWELMTLQAGGDRIDATGGAWKPSVVDYLGFQFESIELVPGESASHRLATINYEDGDSSLEQSEGMYGAFFEGLNEFGLEHAYIPPPVRGTHRATISPREIVSSDEESGSKSELKRLLRRNLVRRTGALEDRRVWSNHAPTRRMDSTPVTRSLNTAEPSESTRTRTDWSAPLIVEKVSFDDLLSDRQRRRLYNSSSDSSDEDSSVECEEDVQGRQGDEEVVVDKGKGRMLDRIHETEEYASTTALAELESNASDFDRNSGSVSSALTELTDEGDSSNSDTQPAARASVSGKATTSSLHHPRGSIANEAAAKKPPNPTSHRSRTLAAMPPRERLGVITNVHRTRSRHTNNASEDERDCEDKNEGLVAARARATMTLTIRPTSLHVR
jgi:hypothetical protein